MIPIAAALVAMLPILPVADPISDGQWYHQFLNTSQAHTLSQGQGVTVAVIDTGVDASHPDLAGSVLEGRDFVGPTNGQTDVDGHGTGMAGLIAGHGKVKGIAPQARILPVRVAIKDEGFDNYIAEAISWAVAKGVKVISISRGSESDSGFLRQNVEAAIAADVVVVAAAGNKPQASRINFPAAFDDVVAVGGVDRNGAVSGISVGGIQQVLAAPSDDTSSTAPGKQYSVGKGTSGSTAIVAGAVALVRSRFPDLSGPEVVRRLTATAIDKGAPGRDSDYGFGVLNLVGALTADLPAETPSAKAAPAPGPETPPGLPRWVLAILVAIITGVIAVGAIAVLRKKATGSPKA